MLKGNRPLRGGNIFETELPQAEGVVAFIRPELEVEEAVGNTVAHALVVMLVSWIMAKKLGSMV